jgi:DNA-3-methyladenine glycosylase I
MTRYHDEEWGVPLHDDRKLFEFLVLDAFQAGLSWAIILRKREALRRAFGQFDPCVVARFTDDQQEILRHNPDIIRNRLKIRATVTNAQAFLQVQEEFGSFDRYLWDFVDGKPVINHWQELSEVPTHSPESDALSRDLKARGFKFVGTTICYAFMQAAGLVNDHLVSCFRYREVMDPLPRKRN